MSIINKLLNKIAKKIFKIENTTKPILTPIENQDLLKDKIILVTGGTGGIGYAIAKQSIHCGAKVIIAGTNEKKLLDYTAQLGSRARSIKLNLCDVTQLKVDVEKAIQSFSEKRIDILVNSAGLHGDWDFRNPSEEVFDKVMDLNVKGTFFLTNYIAKHMVENNIKGHILNVSSSSSLRPAFTPYQISKWAIDGMTKGFADLLLRYGIIVNAIAPGPTATNMVKKKDVDDIYYEQQPSHRYLMPEEIANLAIFMISGMGDGIVGDTFYITGGSGTISYHK